MRFRCSIFIIVTLRYVDFATRYVVDAAFAYATERCCIVFLPCATDAFAAAAFDAAAARRH